MGMIFHSHADKTHLHKKGCALGLNLKVRVFGTWKWPIEPRINGQYIALQHIHQHPKKELWHLCFDPKKKKVYFLKNSTYLSSF